jgi:hypothetical protein
VGELSIAAPSSSTARRHENLSRLKEINQKLARVSIENLSSYWDIDCDRISVLTFATRAFAVAAAPAFVMAVA